MNIAHPPIGGFARIRSEVETRQFMDFMQSSSKRAYSMAIQLTRNPSEAEDLMQETYVKAWRGFDGYVPGRPFINWLLRIMQRAFLDSKRRDNPIRKAESLNSMISPSDGDVQEIPIPSNDIPQDVSLIRAEFASAVRNALEELPGVYRDAITMCDLEGMTYSEIADIQRTTIGTVRSRIHRGRRILRDLIVKSGIEMPDA